MIADWGNDRIQRISGAGAPMSQWGRKGTLAGEFGNPNGIAIDPAGRIWVTEYSNCRVQVLSPRVAPWRNSARPGCAPVREWASSRIRVASPLIQVVRCMSPSLGTTGSRNSRLPACDPEQGRTFSVVNDRSGIQTGSS